MKQIIKVNGEFCMREVYFTEELPSVPEVQSAQSKDESPTGSVGETSEDPAFIEPKITDQRDADRELLIGSPSTEKKRLPIMTPEERMTALQYQRSYKAELEKQATHEELMDLIAFEVCQIIFMIFLGSFFLICLYFGSI